MAGWIISFYVAILAVLGVPASANVICQKPNVSDLHAQWIDYISPDTSDRGHESFFAVPDYRSDIQDALDVESDSQETFWSGNQDNSNCDISHIEQQADVQNRSYCPWYNIYSQSEDRYPHLLAEARCRCKNGAGMGTENPCEPVQYSIRVLRRTTIMTENGYCKYVPGWMSITVGCTMTKAVMSEPSH